MSESGIILVFLKYPCQVASFLFFVLVQVILASAMRMDVVALFLFLFSEKVREGEIISFLNHWQNPLMKPATTGVSLWEGFSLMV